MKRSTLNETAPAPNEPIASLPKNNGRSKSHDESLDLNVILAALQNMLITNLPDKTVPIRSGLFASVPKNVIVLPVLFEDRVKAVIELASLSSFTASHLAFLEQLTASIGIVLNSIEATMQTEGLLKQSQQLAAELQTQQKELQQTNEQLAQKAQQLAEQNVEVERKNQEIEQARRALEEKAKELALTSKYKSEFLANMVVRIEHQRRQAGIKKVGILQFLGRLVQHCVVR